MFGHHDKKGGDSQINGFVGKNVTITGKLEFEGSLRIDGNFNGEINAVHGNFIVGEGAVIEANAVVDTAVISGEFKGNIEGKSRIELRSPGKLHGNIKTLNLIIGEGVIFDGNCEMGERRASVRGLQGVDDNHEGNILKVNTIS